VVASRVSISSVQVTIIANMLAMLARL
jgi:hypothetical protein